jgi:hypothetical protein
LPNAAQGSLRRAGGTGRLRSLPVDGFHPVISGGSSGCKPTSKKVVELALLCPI